MWKKGDSGKRKKKVRDEGFSLRRSENGGYKDPHFQTLAGGGMGSSYPSLTLRAVIKRQGPGISPGDFPRVLLKEKRKKLEPEETPSCLIPRPCVVFTQQIKILVTAWRLLGCYCIHLKIMHDRIMS